MVVVGTISFVNHDCQPNCKFVQEKGNKVSLQAIRDIKLGEELTIFYGNHYFERENKDCECRTCEGKLEGAFRKLKSGERRDRNLYTPKEDKAILKVGHFWTWALPTKLLLKYDYSSNLRRTEATLVVVVTSSGRIWNPKVSVQTDLGSR